MWERPPARGRDNRARHLFGSPPSTLDIPGDQALQERDPEGAGRPAELWSPPTYDSRDTERTTVLSAVPENGSTRIPSPHASGSGWCPASSSQG